MFTSWLKYWRKDMTDLQELRGRRENRKQNCWLISAWSPYKAKYLFVHAVATLGIFLRVFLGRLALSQFFFFRFSITIFSFLDFSSNFFFLALFFAWKQCYEYYFGPCFGLFSGTEYFSTDLFQRTVLGYFEVSKKN